MATGHGEWVRPSAPSNGGGVVFTGLAASTLPGFGDQTITAGSGYVGIFHDLDHFTQGQCTFDGYNVTLLDTTAEGMWYYAANGRIAGSPVTGSCRVVIAGAVYNGTYSGELARIVIPALAFAAQGFVGYSIFTTAFMKVGDNMGVYLVNDTNASLTIDQGDPDDGSGPPSCQVMAYLLHAQSAGS